MSKRGLILLNLGTPEGTRGMGPSTNQVRAYLREFLMDPYVIDIPYPLRWLIVNGTILPFRSSKSAEAYRLIWTERGSPLLYHLEDLAGLVQLELGSEWEVEPAMRYGNPSTESAFSKLQAKGVTETLVLPLYPQYSLAATKSSEVECKRIAAKSGMKLHFYPPFFDEPEFIDAFASVAKQSLKGFKHDYLLFSFHGLPERQLPKDGDPATCYRTQCHTTADLLAKAIGVPQGRSTVSFQSRLNHSTRNPWIRPFTDEVIPELARKGWKRLAVMCPAFVADCLETLEEIEIRAKKDFIAAGGEDLKLVPSLNSSPEWVQAVARMARSYSG